ncbi:MAG: hypothetical protein CVV22_12400 [Ignavibacteriae bacterium HGW-Ignavibacteriae-1]|jgi:hypothetical protein|nr:MAG: hypothetical protein CVV22_12400 [Ignavibacteriae bacterium HGW-Ignavibacteriae-1]
MNFALKKDIEEDYIEAVKLYEDKILNSSDAIEDDYINLAFLYWVFAADYGFYSYYNIPEELRAKGEKEYPKIIKAALNKFPNSLEIKFWERYFPHRHLYNEFTQEEIETMIAGHKGDDSLIPYFYLYLFDSQKYKEERDKLLKVCEETPNAKFKYIKSIIENE